MNKVDVLYKEYNELKDELLKNRSLNLKEDFKNKLIELDYAINADYEIHLENDFPMTTTLEKEESRLEKLITYIEEKTLEQKNLINDYKKLTGEVIELSYLKYTDNIKSYKDRLNNVKRILAITKDIKNMIKNPDNKDEVKVKVIKNRLMKKELLNLLYEFCLIDSLDIKEIDADKLIKTNDLNKTTSKENISITEKKQEEKKVKLPKKIEIKTESKVIIPEVNKENKELKEEKIIKKEDTIKEKKQEVKILKNKQEEKEIEKKKEEKIVEIPVVPENKVINQEQHQEEEKIITGMPIVDKIGSVVPVNVFEALEKTEEKLPDVVLPSNGLKDDENDIFVDTSTMFEDTEKK